MLSLEEYAGAGIPLSGDNQLAALYAEAALDWMAENTTLTFDKESKESLSALPSSAKLFIVQFSSAVGLRDGVASQSIEGLSMSFTTTSKADLIWSLANTFLRPYLKSQVKVFQARRRW